MIRGRASCRRCVRRARCGVLLGFIIGFVLVGASIPMGVRSSAGSLAPDRADEAEWRRFREYIRQSWRMLQRTPRDLVRAAEDPKFPSPTGRWLVYVSPKEDMAALEARVRLQLSPGGVGADRVATLAR